ncbi:MAG: hypothetical protein HPY85_10190 [Anaerolineae bacterium]|nr:hypothetical protein [Anaerolineae bacterium]
MDQFTMFLSQLDDRNRALFESLATPLHIQQYLDSIPYVGEERDRTPLAVMQDRQCHCLDGGLLAALALKRIGLGARIIDLVQEPGLDDDHVLAIYRVNGKYGAVAKSNFTGLRYREPVYRSLRELAMSYFEVFYNIDGIKTLRGYTRPLHLDAFDRWHWQTEEFGVRKVVKRLYSAAMIPLITAEEAERLAVVDPRSYDAGMLGVNLEGLYKPGSGVH